MAVAAIQTVAQDLTFGASSVSVTFGAIPADGELIVVHAYENATVGLTMSAAWATGSSQHTSTTSSDLHTGLFWKIASGESSATYTVTFSTSGSNLEAEGTRWSGANATTPVEVVPSYTDTVYINATVAPSVTTLTAAAVHVVGFTSNDQYAKTTPTGYTDLTPTLSFPRIYQAYKTITSAGATGTQTVGASGSPVAPTAFSYVIKPTATAPSVLQVRGFNGQTSNPTLAFLSPLTAGSTLVVVGFSRATISAPTDTGSHTWTQRASVAPGSMAKLYTAPNSGTTTPTVTFNLSGSNFVSFFIAEVSGGTFSDAVAAAGSNTQTISSGATAAAGASGGLHIGAMFIDGGQTVTLTAPTETSHLSGSPGVSMDAAFGAAVKTSGQTGTTTGTVPFNDSLFAIAAMFDTAGAGGGSTSSTVAFTEADDTVAAASAETITSTAAFTEASDTVAAASAETVTASAAFTEADDTVAAASAETITASAAFTEADDTVAASAGQDLGASVAFTEADDAVVVSAAATTPTTDSTVAFTEDDDAVVAASAEALTASAALVEDDDTVAASAASTPPAGSISIAFVEDDDAVTAAGAVTAPSVAFSAAWTEDDDVCVVLIAETITAAAAYTDDDDAVAAVIVETIGAAASWTEADDTVVANLVGGLSISVAVVEPDDVVRVGLSPSGAPVITGALTTSTTTADRSTLAASAGRTTSTPTDDRSTRRINA